MKIGTVSPDSSDASHQLTRIDFPGGTFAAYAYDALGRRIQKNVNGEIRTGFGGDALSDELLRNCNPSLRNTVPLP